ncbi:MAG: Imm8 family immunity protein [Myxococcota bacterium]
MTYLVLQDLVVAPDLVNTDWPSYRDEDVFFLVDVFVGAKDTHGNNRFDFTVATREALKKEGREDKSNAHGYFIFDHHFDLEAIHRYVDTCIRESDTGEWQSSIDNLRKHFRWEFEGLINTGPWEDDEDA